MKILTCKKKGFTLVEILVVIMIVGMLSVLAVSGYTQYRRSTLLDLSVDSLISQMYALRDKTIHGDVDSGRADKVRQAVESRLPTVVDSDSEAKCYGLYFHDNTVGGFEVLFSNTKIWDAGKNDWVYMGCREFNSITATTPFEFDEMFSIVSDNDLVLTFSPPDGKMSARRINSFVQVTDEIELVAKYGVGDEAQYKRHITINLISGKITVNKM